MTTSEFRASLGNGERLLSQCQSCRPWTISATLSDQAGLPLDAIRAAAKVRAAAATSTL